MLTSLETPHSQKAARLALGGLIAIQLITGGTYLVAKLALREIAPIPLGCLRFLITGTVFSVLLFGKRLALSFFCSTTEPPPFFFAIIQP